MGSHNRKREMLVLDAMKILRQTREKFAREHPDLLLKAQKLLEDLNPANEPENYKAKNKRTVMRFLEIRSSKLSALDKNETMH